MYKIKLLKVQLAFMLIFTGFLAISQEQAGTLSFSFEEAKAYAIKNSYQTQTATKEIEKSKRIVKETTAIGLPQVNASSSYQNFIKQPVQLIPGESFGGEEGEFQEVVFGTKQNIGIDVTATQLIFDGSYLVGLQSSKVYLELTENIEEKTQYEIIDLVSMSYGNVLLAEKSAEILKSNKENLEKTVYETEELFKNGFAEELDVDQFKLLLSNMTNSFGLAERQIAISRNQLKFIMGIEVSNTLILTDDLETITINSKSEEFVNKDFNLNQHIDFRTKLTEEKAAELSLKFEKSAYMPSFSAFYNYQYNSFSNEFNFFENAPWYPTQVVGLNLNIPIFSSFSRHNKVQQSKIDYEKIQISKKQVEQQLTIAAIDAKSNYTFAIKQYQSMVVNLGLAERIYDKVNQKYSLGVSSSLDLSQANDQLLQSQSDFILASIQLINSKIELNKALNNY